MTGVQTCALPISVPMTETLARVLRKVVDENTSDYLVEYHGRPIADIKTTFNSAVKLAELENVKIHDLRHTAAVWMAGEGVEMSKISQYLGHSSTAVTERIYARYQPEHLAKAASAVNV